MPGPYRQITPEQRADHVENLHLLRALVNRLPVRPAVQRSFVVMTIQAA